MSILAAGLTLFSAFFHAGWNLLARKYRGGNIFLRVPLLIFLIGILPTLLSGMAGVYSPPRIWAYYTLSGICLAFYYLGLTQGYQNGDFTVVYPLARSLPVLVLAFADIAQGNHPTFLGWSGIVLVAVGCALSPLESLHSIRLADYMNPVMVWILMTAAGMVGYTWIDNLAADQLPGGVAPVLRYQVCEVSVSFVVFWLLLKAFRQAITWEWQPGSWKWPALMAALLYGAYTLVLIAYQYSLETSYVAALRQFSIVIGVPIGAFYFKEKAPWLRIIAAITITTGIVCITLGG